MRAYRAPVSLRNLFGILVAVALLFAPALTRAGAAYAGVPDHHAQMMEPGHCQAPPSHPGDRNEAPAKNCCISMCMAVAVTAPAPLAASDLPPTPAVFAVASLHLAYLGEIATPPPRAS